MYRKIKKKNRKNFLNDWIINSLRRKNSFKFLLMFYFRPLHLSRYLSKVIGKWKLIKRGIMALLTLLIMYQIQKENSLLNCANISSLAKISENSTIHNKIYC